MRIIATQRDETVISSNKEYVQITKKVVKIESSSFDEPNIDELNSIIFDAIKKHMELAYYNR